MEQNKAGQGDEGRRGGDGQGDASVTCQLAISPSIHLAIIGSSSPKQL